MRSIEANEMAVAEGLDQGVLINLNLEEEGSL